jgi:excisionase family DNA binding protein
MIGKPVALLQIPCQRLFGMKAAARYLGISGDTLRKYADLGMIPAQRLENRRVFKLEDLDAFIDSLPEYTSYPYTDRGGKPGGKESRNGS